MTAEIDLTAAKARALAARLAFRRNLAETRERVKPARLKEDAVLAAKRGLHDAKTAAQSTARHHPVATWSTAAAIALFILRDPIETLACRGKALAVRIRDRITEWRNAHD